MSFVPVAEAYPGPEPPELPELPWELPLGDRGRLPRHTNTRVLSYNTQIRSSPRSPRLDFNFDKREFLDAAP